MDVVDEGGSCEKDLTLLGREFQRRQKELWKERSMNLSLDVSGENKTDVVRGASYTNWFDIDKITEIG